MDEHQLSKMLAGELSPEEIEAYLISFEDDDELYEATIFMKNIWAAAQLSAAPDDERVAQEGWAKLRANIKKERRHRWKWLRIAAAALMTGVIIFASFFAGQQIIQKKFAAVAYLTLAVPAGEFAQLTLSDGSEVWLNACSKLTYPERFTSKTREIKLEGEGLFKVASNVKRSFVVKTESVDVIATGTQFNVSAYSDENQITATLIEGVISLVSETRGMNFKVNAGQMAVFDKKTEQISAKETDTDMQTAWIHGEFRFRDMTLEDIAKRFERMYAVTFVFDNEIMKQRKFTGTFYKHQTVESILQILQITGKFQYSIEMNTVFIK